MATGQDGPLTVGQDFFKLLDLVKNSDKYEGRMTALREQEDAALRALGGKEKLAEIEVKHAQARKVLDDAFHEMENAREEADHIVETAKLAGNKIVQEAEEKKASFQAWAKEEADRLAGLKAELDSRASKLAIDETIVRNAGAEAEKAAREAKALKDRLDARVAELASVGVKIV